MSPAPSNGVTRPVPRAARLKRNLTNYDRISCFRLRNRLSKRGLPRDGTKVQLIARILPWELAKHYHSFNPLGLEQRTRELIVKDVYDLESLIYLYNLSSHRNKIDTVGEVLLHEAYLRLDQRTQPASTSTSLASPIDRNFTEIQEMKRLLDDIISVQDAAFTVENIPHITNLSSKLFGVGGTDASKLITELRPLWQTLNEMLETEAGTKEDLKYRFVERLAHDYTGESSSERPA